MKGARFHARSCGVPRSSLRVTRSASGRENTNPLTLLCVRPIATAHSAAIGADICVDAMNNWADTQIRFRRSARGTDDSHLYGGAWRRLTRTGATGASQTSVFALAQAKDHAV